MKRYLFLLPTFLVLFINVSLAQAAFVVDRVDEGIMDEEQAQKALFAKDFYTRMHAISSLRPYKNEKNVQLVSRLLADEWFYLYGNGEVKKRYPIRSIAYEVLREWDIKVSLPVIEEPISLD